MSRLARVVLVLATAVGLGVVVGVPGASAVTLCNELTGHPITGDVSGNLIVEGTCHIHGYTITGNVTVNPGATLFTRDGTVIRGSLVANQPKQVNIEDHTEIGGSVTINGASADAFGGFICGSTIGGGVTVQNINNTNVTWVIGAPSGGPFPDDTPYQFSSADPDLNCVTPNTIGGAVRFVNNNVARIKIEANTIGGSVSLTNNTVLNEILRVEGNVINGGLSCSGNDWSTGGPPDVTEGQVGNQIRGSATGQCAGFGEVTYTVIATD